MSKPIKTATVEDVLSWHCYVREPFEPPSEARIRKMLSTIPKRFSALDILHANLPITPDELAWLVLRKELLSDRVSRLSAVDSAHRALTTTGNKPDMRSLEAVKVATRHANGAATDVELSEACSKAWSAVWLATRSAEAGSAANVARSAAWAAESAARAAAWSSLTATLASADGAAERAAQLKALCALLEAEEAT